MQRWIYDRSSFFLILIFVVATALIFFLLGLTYKHLEKFSRDIDAVNHSYDVSLSLERLYTEIKELETQKRNYILTHDPAIVAEIKERKNRVNKNFNELKFLLKDNEEQLKNMDMLSEMIQFKYRIIDESFTKDLSMADQDQLKANLLAGKNIMASISDKVDEMQDVESILMTERKTAFGVTQKSTPLFIYLISLFALGLLSFAFYKIFKDVKEQRIINNNLHLAINSSKLAEIAGNFGIWTYDEEKKKFEYSDNIYRMLGHKPRSFDLTLEEYIKHLHPDDMREMEQHMSEYKDVDHFQPFAYRIIRKDGTVRYFEASGRTMADMDGNQVILGITSDITDDVDAKHHLKEQNRILAAANKDLTAFNYVASHDLQEPLRKIETFISRLNDKDRENLSDTGKSYLDRMNSSAGRMRTLIEDLLQFSRTTKAEKDFEKVNLNELMENSVEELHQMIEEKQAELKIDKLPVMMVIPFQIQQLFTNLINNSLKYSKPDVEPKISITFEKVNAADDERLNKESGNYYKIRFTDNGIGFEQEFSDKIFTLFTRLHNRSEYSGTGIGLAVCKKIVENHHGFIFADSEPNVGTTFTVYLPEIHY